MYSKHNIGWSKAKAIKAKQRKANLKKAIEAGLLIWIIIACVLWSGGGNL